MSRTKEKELAQLTDRILTAHRSLVEHENGTPSRVRALHIEAMDAFLRLGFPGARSEAWKYTPVSRWLSDDLTFATGTGATTVGLSDWLAGVSGFIAVSVDGRFRPDLSRLPEGSSGLVVTSLSEAMATHTDVVSNHLGKYAGHEDEVFAALNTAFVKNGLFVHVKEGATLDRPLFITDLPSEGARLLRQPRNLFVFEDNTRASVVEWYDRAEADEGMDNALSEISIGAGADIHHCHVFDRGAKARLVNAMYAYQRRDSRFTTNHVTLTGSLVRHNLNFLPDDEGCETHLFGLMAARDDMHVDIHSFVDHAKPLSVSNELYKCILDGRSTGVFNGKVLVRQDAQQINAYQSNRSILLSDDARMFSKPELEIYADDVKCSHGATTGRLDAEAIFYLRSRGLCAEDARLLLLQSFAAEVINQIEVKAVSEEIMRRLSLRLRAGESV